MMNKTDLVQSLLAQLMFLFNKVIDKLKGN